MWRGFTHLFRGEILGRTLHHYFLAPMPRSVLVVGKYLAGLLASYSLALFGVAMALLPWYLMLFTFFGKRIRVGTDSVRAQLDGIYISKTTDKPAGR